MVSGGGTSIGTTLARCAVRTLCGYARKYTCAARVAVRACGPSMVGNPARVEPARCRSRTVRTCIGSSRRASAIASRIARLLPPERDRALRSQPVRSQTGRSSMRPIVRFRAGRRGAGRDREGVLQIGPRRLERSSPHPPQDRERALCWAGKQIVRVIRRTDLWRARGRRACRPRSLPARVCQGTASASAMCGRARTGC
jgi:hypothetical protein